MENLLSEDLAHILLHTRNLWENLRNKNIFITGGTGFFGCWLVHSFLEANKRLELNAQATVLSRDPAKFLARFPELQEDKGIFMVQGDVRSFPFPDRPASFIIHAATESSTNLNQANPLEMLDTIISGTRHVLDYAVRNPVEKLLYISSGAVYGKQPYLLSHIPETFLGGPDQLSSASAYAEGKRVAELYCKLYPSLSVNIGRGFAFVGPFMPRDTHYAINDFINDAIMGKSIKVNGDGTPYRSYLYAADLAIWLWTILFSGNQGEVYNVGSPDEIQILDVARTVARQFTPEPEVHVLVEKEPGKPPERYVPDVQKAMKELDLKAWIPLETAIKKTIAWKQCDV
jgi:nucleoside-diphosphate-sugar epimerase